MEPEIDTVVLGGEKGHEEEREKMVGMLVVISCEIEAMCSYRLCWLSL